MQARWSKLWRTVRHLKPVQIYGRVWFRLHRPKPGLAPAPALRLPVRSLEEVAHRRISMTGPGAFIFLGDTGTLSDHGWDNPALAKLWRYNQHYFDDLNAVSAADRKPWHEALIADWVAQNAPRHGSGWEPYPTSLRIVNWIKFSLAGNDLPKDALNSLAVQVRWLARRLEWHLLGNHLFVNAKALVFAGLFFGGPEAERWLRTGIRILRRQIPEQILSDGGQFELSPMYHALAVEDMLDLVNITRAFGRDDLAQDWAEPVPAMLDWLATMSHPDGDLGFFNDTALGVAPSNDEIFIYAGRLGFNLPAAPNGLTHLAASGYVRLAKGDAVVLADVARVGPDYLPGHAHADTLSYELSVSGRRVVVNSGTSVYGLGPERLRQRATAAHSTVVIDGHNSSEVWSGFRVGRRAKPFDIHVDRADETLDVSAAHDGYRHLPGAPVHWREWTLADSRLTVTDRIDGQGHHRIEVFQHLAPGIIARQYADGYLLLEDENGYCIARIDITGGQYELIASSWHPEFGKSVPTQCLKLVADIDLPSILFVEIDWSNL